MPDDRPRIILEKSRTVRRRYQRSNKRLQFTASQIARIEREEERERRAQKLREKEKRRIAEKKKRAEKEAKAREERLRQGLPDPNAPTVPASQPSLFNFIKKASTAPEGADVKPHALKEDERSLEGPCDKQSELVSPMTESTEIATDVDEELDLDDHQLEGVMAIIEPDICGGLITADTSTKKQCSADMDIASHGNCGDHVDDEDEFSDCSIFNDEEVIKEAVQYPRKRPERLDQTEHRAPPRFLGGDSFQDDTAVFLDQFGHEFDPGEEFEMELARLDGI